MCTPRLDIFALALKQFFGNGNLRYWFTVKISVQNERQRDKAVKVSIGYALQKGKNSSTGYCVWECVCVCERERERDDCVWERVCVGERERERDDCVWERVLLRSIWCDSWLANNNVFNGRLNELKCWSYYTTHHHHHCRYHTPSPSSQSSAYTLPKLKTAFHGSLMIMFHLLGGSSGLVITGEDSCSRYRGFESQHRILEWHFHICYKNCIVGLIRPKIIEKESGMAHLCNASPFCYRQC